MENLLSVEKKPDIWVGSEWGKLKEVIIGRTDQFCYPFLKEVYRERIKIFDEENQQRILARAGKTIQEASPVEYEKMLQEMAGWQALLENHGVKVHVVRRLSPEEMEYLEYGACPLFTKDPLSVVATWLSRAATARCIVRKKSLAIVKS